MKSHSQPPEPNFLIIGAQKAGTTSLWDLLRQHPQIFLCDPKEPFFFPWDDVYARGWDWYRSLFVDARHSKAVGEATTLNSLTQTYPRVAPRIAKHLPRARIIFIVRHPLERLESAWLQFLHRAYPTPARFATAVRRYPPLLDGSMYWRTLTRYREYFDDNKILVLFFEELKSNPHALLAKCHRFLGVDASDPLCDAHVARNRTGGKDMERRIFVKIRQTRAYPFLRRAVPDVLAKRLRVAKWRRMPLPKRPSWDPATRRWAIDQVGPDAQAFLRYVGKPTTYWLLDDHGP